MSEKQIPESRPLGPNGPTQSEVDALKETHGTVKACFLGGKVYVIRMMNRTEHLNLMQDLEDRVDKNDMDFDVDQMVAEGFTVWPKGNEIDWTGEPGGVVGVLSQEVSKFSGFIRDKDSIEL